MTVQNKLICMNTGMIGKYPEQLNNSNQKCSVAAFVQSLCLSVLASHSAEQKSGRKLMHANSMTKRHIICFMWRQRATFLLAERP